MGIFISVVVPAKNEARFIVESVGSLFACHYPSELLEVIVVDNSSTDDTVALLSLFAQKNLRVVTSSATTIAGVRMDGYQHCKGEVVGFLDADSVVETGWLAKGMEILATSPDISCVGFAPAQPGPSAPWVERTWYGISSGSKWSNRQEVPWLSSFNLLIKRGYFERVGGFDKTLPTCEDADLGYRLSEISKLIFSDEVRVCHLGNVKTLKGFYLKEIWRGQSNFSQFLFSGNKRLHYKSVFAPIVYTLDLAVCCILLACWLLLDLDLTAFCAVTGLFAVLFPLFLALRAEVRGGWEIVRTSFLYCIYLVARGVSIVMP
jgi:glycosyltransferase involved in cell wall biosynthesis